MSDAEEIQKLKDRIAALESSNEVAWSWIRALASQDTMVLQLAARMLDKSPDWPEKRDRAINQIIENNRIINNLPVPRDE